MLISLIPNPLRLFTNGILLFGLLLFATGSLKAAEPSARFAIRLVVNDATQRRDPSKFDHLPLIRADGKKETLWVDRTVLLGSDSLLSATVQTQEGITDQGIAKMKAEHPEWPFTDTYIRSLKTPIEGFEIRFKDSKALERVTSMNVHKRLAVILDGTVLMAPVVGEAISGDTLKIAGNFSKEQTKNYVESINSIVPKS